MSPTRIIAHRGASAYAPENTLPSFKMALEMGAEGLELDVHLSRDGHLMVIHDEKVDRTSSGKGFVKDMTLSQLKKLDFGSWFSEEYAGTSIPTLEEVLELLSGWNGLLNIEIKSGPIVYPGIEKKLIETVKAFGFEDKVIFSSFNHYSLRDIKEIDPSMKIGLLYMAGLVEPWHYAKRLDASALHPLFYNIIPEMVLGCKIHNIALHPFTVDEEAHLALMMKAGVEGVITNKPDTALEVRKLVTEGCSKEGFH